MLTLLDKKGSIEYTFSFDIICVNSAKTHKKKLIKDGGNGVRVAFSNVCFSLLV